jgi:hypothetical protein
MYLVDAMTSSEVKRDAGDRLSLHSLLVHARLLCCVQRYASQPENAHGG